jgi:hypothetical protein
MRDRPCHSTLHLPSRALPPRRPVSFLHRAPRASHPLTRKSPIKSRRPEPCSSKQGLPLDFLTPAVEIEQRAKVSRHDVFNLDSKVCRLWVSTSVALVQFQSLPRSGGGRVSRFCSADVALSAALVQGIMQRSTGAPPQPQDPL